MARESKYFPLSLESLRAVGGLGGGLRGAGAAEPGDEPRVPASGAKASQAKRR